MGVSSQGRSQAQAITTDLLTHKIDTSSSVGRAWGCMCKRADRENMIMGEVYICSAPDHDPGRGCIGHGLQAF